jgi:hypothetical protein
MAVFVFGARRDAVRKHGTLPMANYAIALNVR